MSSERFTVCCWAGYEGNRSSFRPRVKRRAAVLCASGSAEHDSSSGARVSAVTVDTQLQSVVDLLVNYIGLMFNLYF